MMGEQVMNIFPRCYPVQEHHDHEYTPYLQETFFQNFSSLGAQYKVTENICSTEKNIGEFSGHFSTGMPALRKHTEVFMHLQARVYCKSGDGRLPLPSKVLKNDLKN